MRLAFFLLIFSILYGCMPNQGLSTADASEINVINISRLEKGMNQVQVLKIMRQPYLDKVFVLDNDTYDVWFYVTTPTVMGQSRMTPVNLTPLAFKNGILIGCGNYYYNFIKSWYARVEKEKLAPPLVVPQEIKQKNLENQDLEKVLKETVVPGQPQAPHSVSPNSIPTSPKKPGSKGGAQQRAEPPLNLSPISPQKPPQQQAPNQQQKGQSQTQPTQSPAQPTKPSGPNWSPLEPSPPAPQPSQGQQPAKPASSQTSMSSKPKAPERAEEQGSKPRKTEENKVPLTEEDEDMLQEERDQDFNQT